ncbi:hypothetical protein NMY22_g691 [Coprinellus aureogranulatus]|nr:hypothetical protein NMY22_g691 [Coprinellus aureogranulatus]
MCLLRVEACLTLLHAFAVGSTGLRLWDRYRSCKLWWDDYVAVIPMLCDAFYGILFWFRFMSKGILTPEERHEISKWTVANSFLYYTIIWTSRISLSLSLTTNLPPRFSQKLAIRSRHLLRRRYSVSFILSVVTCSAGSIDWRKLQFDTRTCRKGPDGFYLGGIIATTFDFLADAVLVICPLVLLWRVHLLEIDRRVVLAAFSASLLTALAATVFCVFWYGGLPLGPDQSILISATAISLIVCNTLIVSMYFYRQIRQKDGIQASPAISTFSDEPTGLSVSERRIRRDVQCNNRPYATAPPRLVRSESGGVSYELPERLTHTSDCVTIPRWGDAEDNEYYPETASSQYAEELDDIPSWMARGAGQLSITSTFESAIKRDEARKAKKPQMRETGAGKSNSPPRGRRECPYFRS